MLKHSLTLDNEMDRFDIFELKHNLIGCCYLKMDESLKNIQSISYDMWVGIRNWKVTTDISVHHFKVFGRLAIYLFHFFLTVEILIGLSRIILIYYCGVSKLGMVFKCDTSYMQTSVLISQWQDHVIKVFEEGILHILFFGTGLRQLRKIWKKCSPFASWVVSNAFRNYPNALFSLDILLFRAAFYIFIIML